MLQGEQIYIIRKGFDSLENQSVKEALRKRAVTLPDGAAVPALGQGTWRIGDDPAKKEAEVRALRLGVDLGMSLIDTAEMYGEGRSERVVGEAIRGIRDEVFLVSKVYPHNAGLDQITASCEKSLQRLQTDRLDLYLLHWRGRVPLEETIEGMERLKKEGKIIRWGVSNFDTVDMKELLQKPGGNGCAVNQVLYHLGSRGIEFDLLPWHKKQGIPVMAYSPLAQGGSLRKELMDDPVVQKMAQAHGASPLQIMLAWAIRFPGMIAIPKSAQEEHTAANAKAAQIVLTEQELAELNERFSAPGRKVPLDII
ncbi:aldo/keto reductase [Domibacillus indicus]|uniref:aldo/keto reductase n=1 Tax=Domibacillus indicus TaxID=1437523 RepID=UPI0020407EB2|nr:aldo/keto reductase [Domibacillus indicus]MCM3788599.1 aldo/keto reductase [Domibacillus indicus]